MPQNKSKLAKLAADIDATEIPAVSSGLSLLPVSSSEFQARWSLSPETVEKGRRAAAKKDHDSHLVLRAFVLPAKDQGGNPNNRWQDYAIEGVENSAYFSLPGPTERIQAALGLINKEGRFRPLERAKPIQLPAPKPTPNTASKPAPAPEAEAATRETSKESAPLPTRIRPTNLHALNESEITARLEQLHGLPDSFKVAPDPLTYDPISNPAITHQGIPSPENRLDERKILETVRRQLALEPNPSIERASPTGKASGNKTDSTSSESGTAPADQLASQFEDMWLSQAPIELRANYQISGRIASGLRLMMGNQIIEPAPDGHFNWNCTLSSFEQIWPILKLASETPKVAAGATLEFFKDSQPKERLFELHGALEVEGKITDPEYLSRLPENVRLNGDGQFKFTRLLPDGAIILPGISLLGEK